jgi:hypothetical protein
VKLAQLREDRVALRERREVIRRMNMKRLVHCVGGDAGRLVHADHGLINEQGGAVHDVTGSKVAGPALVIHLHPEQALNGVGLRIVVDHLVMVRAQQDEVVIPVAVTRALLLVETRAVGPHPADMADLADHGIAISTVQRG